MEGCKIDEDVSTFIIQEFVKATFCAVLADFLTSILAMIPVVPSAVSLDMIESSELERELSYIIFYLRFTAKKGYYGKTEIAHKTWNLTYEPQ